MLEVKERVKLAIAVWFRPLVIVSLVAVLFEEMLPEPIAKPIVVGSILSSITLHMWSWKKRRKWLRP